MIRLKPSQYNLLVPLLGTGIAQAYLPTLFAVFEGNAEAAVYVDNIQSPGQALVALMGGWVFPLGKSDVAFARDTIPSLLANCDVGYPLFAIWPTSPAWETTLAENYALWMTRIHFTYTGGSGSSGPRTTSPHVIPIEFGRMARMTETIDPWLPDRWNTLAASASPTFGYCITVDGELASAAWAGLIGMRVAQFDVVTNPSHLRHGYGQAVCRAMLAHCARENLVPYWSTDLANTPSFHLAIKLGFAPTSKSIAYVWCQELSKPNPKWGSDLTAISVSPKGSHPAVQITRTQNAP